jgi:hypothetical protein
MTDVQVMVAASLATSPLELIVLIATVIVLCVRAIVGITGVGITKRTSLIFTNVTLAMVAIFAILVVYRFRVLG